MEELSGKKDTRVTVDEAVSFHQVTDSSEGINKSSEATAKRVEKPPSAEIGYNEANRSKIEEHEVGEQEEKDVCGSGTGPKIHQESEDQGCKAVEEECDRPPILSPEIAQVFSRILNKLDARSFLNLAAASKETVTRINDSAGVSISLPCIIKANLTNNGDFVYRVKRDRYGKTMQPEVLKKIEQLPFELVPTLLETDCNAELNAQLIQALDQHMMEMRIRRIDGIHARIQDWQAMVAFCQKYQVKKLVEKTNCSDSPPPLSDETVSAFQDLNLNTFWYEGHASNAAILSSTMPRLYVQGAMVPLAVCQLILEQWLTGDRIIQMLGVGCEMTNDDLHKLFATYLHVGEDDPVPTARPFVVHKEMPVYDDEDFIPASMDDFWIVRADGSWVWSSVVGGMFFMTSPADDDVRPDFVPSILKDL